MDAVKNVVGLGQKTQEGQEPVSGQQGAGTAGEPFDAGNKEGTADNAELGGKAPQETGKRSPADMIPRGSCSLS